MIDLTALEGALEEGGNVDDRRAQRLLDALRDPASTPVDVVPLLRQVLRSARADYRTPALTVLKRPGLADECEAAGMTVQAFGRDHLRIEAPATVDLGWLRGRSEWLELATAAPGHLPADNGRERLSTESRQRRPVPADPMFARLTGHPEHRMPEQRESVREVMLAPPGSVTHVVLPTGAGKTIVGLLPALLGHGKQVIVVVPTVAIALDQERALNEGAAPGGVWEGFPAEVAWHGELPQEQRSLIRDRLLNGTQRVLFTSPESVVTSLEPTLLAAANRGQVHTIVFDEAHLIATWGLDFRPEMQLVAAVRQQLLDATQSGGHEAIRTVLLTATLDRQALQLNAALFPNAGGLRLVGAPALRTEPRFMRGTVQDDHERFDRLAEFLQVAPRPAIVYATKVATAEAAYESLRTAGLTRVALFTGATGGVSRRAILDGWRGEGGGSRFDVVVGTAAFGLGVDQPNVRTVIHVEAPASIGSFYQEVGRGGRDGHACLSVLLSKHSDIANTRVADATIITAEKAFARWSAMATTRSSTDPVTVDVTVRPEHIGFAGQRNELWNKNTLVLLQRAGLIRLLPQPVLDRSATEEEWDERYRRVAIEFLTAEAITFEVVRRAVGRVRSDSMVSRTDDRDAVRELLGGDTCFGDLFAAAYTFDLEESRVGSHPTPACSGCPSCLRAKLTPADVVTSSFSSTPGDSIAPTLAKVVGDGPVLVVHDDEAWLDRNGPTLLAKLAEAGCRHLFLEKSERRLARALDRLPFVAVDPSPEGLFPFVRPSIVWRPSVVQPSWSRSVGPLRVIVVATGTPAPDRPDHPLEDWWAPARRARQLMEHI